MSARRRLTAGPSSALVAFRVTAEERGALVLEARERGLDVSALVRLAVAELLAHPRRRPRTRRASADGPAPVASAVDALASLPSAAPRPADASPARLEVAEPSAEPPPVAGVAESSSRRAAAAHAPPGEPLERALVAAPDDPLAELLATVRTAAAPGLEVPLVLLVALLGDEDAARARLGELAARGDVVLEGDLVRLTGAEP